MGTSLQKPGTKIAISKWIFAALVAAVVANFLISHLTLTPPSSALLETLETLPTDSEIELASREPFHGYEMVCVLTPYAVGSAKMEAADLKRIFGSIDYSSWKDEIVQDYVDYHELGFYPVQSNHIIEPVVIKGLRLRLANLSFQEDTKFGAGCYRTESICLHKASSQPSTIYISHCNK